MSLESQRKYRVFFSQKETTAGTPNSTCQFEGRGEMGLPEPTWLHEPDRGRLGSGEHGRTTVLQAVYTPWSYKTRKLSEISYLMSYFQGNTDRYITISSGVYMHEFTHMRVHERTLPTFTIEYGIGGTGENKRIAGCVVSKFSISLASGGNGIVDATFEGWGNRHYLSSGVITELAAGNMSSGALNLDSEPMINYKCSRLWIADDLESGFGITSISTEGENLGTTEINLTTLYNKITFTGDNGRSAEDCLRAGGCGIVNDYTRGDRAYTLEVELRKDLSIVNLDTYLLANSTKAMQLQFSGPHIASVYDYGINFFWPRIQIINAPQNAETPISRTVATEVMQDSDNDAFVVFTQSAVASGYNA